MITWLVEIWQLAWGAMLLSPQAFSTVLTRPGGSTQALVVLLIAGISLTAGQSIILFANQVPPRRFLGSLLGGSLLLLATVNFWAVSTWLILEMFLGEQVSLREVAPIVALSYAPYWLGFLILLPYLGNLLAKFLPVWVFFALLVGIGTIYDLTFWQALATCLLGWLFYRLLTLIPVLDVNAWQRRLFLRVDPDHNLQETSELVDSLVDATRLGAGPSPDEEESP